MAIESINAASVLPKVTLGETAKQTMRQVPEIPSRKCWIV